MTEEEWLTAWDCRALYGWRFRDQRCESVRRCQLFMVAACRLMRDAFCLPHLSVAVELVERCADNLEYQTALELIDQVRVSGGERLPPDFQLAREIWELLDLVSLLADQVRSETPLDENWFRHYSWKQELVRAVSCSLTAQPNLVLTGGYGDSVQNVMTQIEMAYLLHRGHDEYCYGSEETPEIRLPMADLLRDIFGNPFRPVAFNPAWRTEHTVGIAAKMYDDRDFRAMPILADALEEAGCDNPDILTHCRDAGVHVRGCWVVDLVLGKG